MVTTTLDETVVIPNDTGRSGYMMETLQRRIFAPLRRYAEYSRIVAELSEFRDRDLRDMGIARTDIKRIAREGSRGA